MGQQLTPFSMGCSPPLGDRQNCHELVCCQYQEREDGAKTRKCCMAEQICSLAAVSETYQQSAPATATHETVVLGREPTWPSDLGDGQDVDSPKARKQRHLVINMDINKTIIMSDKVSQKTVEMVANEVMSNCAWGNAVDGKWMLIQTKPTHLRPSSELVSYAEWLEKQFPGSDHKKKRTQLNGMFTCDGQPGNSFAGHAKRMCDVLKRPDGSNVKIIPAFFELLKSLKRNKRSFKLCFRTFGADLDDVAEEMNSFCEGRHPYYPGVRMDGSDGEPDYRFNVSDKATCGTFHRENGCVSLIMGTQEQPGEGKYKDAKDKSIRFYDNWADIHIITGYEAVSRFLWDHCSRCGTVGLRDYFAFWKAKKMSSDGGKMFFFKPQRSTNRHEVFFDDNITFDEGYIVQPIDMDLPNTKPIVAHLIESHLCRAEPIMSIVDDRYFCNELARLEAGYERKLEVRRRMSEAMREAMRSNSDNGSTFKEQCKRLSEVSSAERNSDYDPWRESRTLNKRLSLVRVDMEDAKVF